MYFVKLKTFYHLWLDYNNKLKLRREIRIGKKMGHSFKEIQPSTTAHMFANDPLDPVISEDDQPNQPIRVPSTSRPNLARRTRGRPKSKKRVTGAKVVESPLQRMETRQNLASLVETETADYVDDNDFINADFNDDNVISREPSPEMETKFWVDDPSKLQVEMDNSPRRRKRRKVNYNEDDDNYDEDDDLHDPDYEGEAGNSVHEDDFVDEAM